MKRPGVTGYQEWRSERSRVENVEATLKRKQVLLEVCIKAGGGVASPGTLP